MNHPEETLRSRLALWLRSERAFGLNAVALRTGASQSLSGQAAGAEGEPARAEVESQTGTEPANLFGIPENPAAPAVRLDLLVPAQAPFVQPELSAAEKRKQLLHMDMEEVRACTRCGLCQTRRNTVFGEGDPDGKIFFIGEGPGETEDQTGRPFVGRAGELLDRMINAMGLSRQQVYIANLVKCRPPGNREPAPDEVATCTPFLERQIAIVRPRVIVTLGRPATQYMLGQKISITKIRGQWQSWRGIKLMPTFHPAYILRQYTPQTRAAVWADLQQVMSELGLSRPGRRAAQEV